MAHVGARSSSGPDGGAYLQISPLTSNNSHPPNYSHAGQRLTPPRRPVTQAIGTQRHARRLQLRHAGFPALFPGRTDAAAARRTTSRHSLPANGAPGLRDRGISPEAPEHRQRSTSPDSPSILQEINNHATVRRVSGRSLLSSIFHHSSRSSLSNADFAIFDDEGAGASQSSQIQPEGSNHEMPGPSQGGRSRRSSGRGLAVGKLRQKPSISGRSTSFDAAKYIEHLESELVSVNSKLDALASPSISRSQSAKIRALNKQALGLRKEVVDWETKFEERVKEHVFDQKRIEASLKARISELREEVDAKDLQVSDLQRELEAVHERLAANEALETDMNRRIDVLTQLLAQSPTRSNFANTSPTVAGESTKRGRPNSMMLPNLKTSAFELGQGESETPTRTGRGNRAMDSPSLARRRSEQLWSQVLPPKECLESGELATLPESDRLRDSGTDRAMSDTSRVFSELSSMQSPPSSRPTSLMSNSSIWSAWGLPLQAEIPSRAESRSRRMRRFVNGSNALKPLLLPTSTGMTEPGSPSGELLEWRDAMEATNALPDASQIHLSDLPANGEDEVPSPSDDQTLTPQPAKNGVDATPVLGQADENFYRHLLARNTPSPERHTSLHSPTMASSPLMESSWAAPRLGTESPSTPAKFARNISRESSAPSTGTRTVRIQTPNSNLDALLMEETPSKIPRGPNLQEELRNVNASLDSTPIRRSKLSIYAPQISDSFVERIARLMLSLKRETLQNMKAVLVSSWARGTAGFGALGWWLFGLVSSSQNILMPGYRSRESRRSSQSHRQGSVDITLPSSGLVAIPEERFLGMPWHWRSTSKTRSPQALDKVPKRRCPDCVEPALRRNLRLWCKLSLTIVLALGIALLNGPEDVLEDREKTLRTRKSCPELKA